MGDDLDQFEDNQYVDDFGYHNKSYEDAVELIQKKSKFPLFFLIIIITFFTIITLSFFVLMEEGISEKQLSSGKRLSLDENEQIIFVINKEEHKLNIRIKDDSVDIIIQSDPIRFNLKVREEKKIDMDNDGIYDLLLRLYSIKNGKPDIFIKKISERIKEEEIEEKIEEEIEEEAEQEIENGAINDIQSNQTDVIQDVTDDINTIDEEQNILTYDCGTSADISTFPEVTEKINLGTIKTNNCSSDETAICMGKNLLECNVGKAVINSEGNLLELEIKEKIGNDCKIRMEYGEMQEVTLSNKYIECLFPISDMSLAICMGKQCSFADDSPCYITSGIINSLTLQLAFGGEDCEIGYPEDKGPTIELSSCEREINDVVNLNTMMLCLEPFLLKKGYTWACEDCDLTQTSLQYFYGENQVGVISSVTETQKLSIIGNSLGGEKELVTRIDMPYLEVTPEKMMSFFK